MSLNSASLTTTTANIYASSGNSVMSVAYLCNYSASPVTVNVFAVASGGTASTSNIIYSNVTITAGDTLVIDKEKIIFANGETLKANSSANSAVTSTVSYTGV